jgi:predicted alpha/beta superfamily hydrolase
MNRILLTLTLLSIILSSCKEKPVESNNNIIIGKRDTIFSNVYNEKRVVWVSVPSDFNKNFPPRNYPVVYLLDGPDHFISTVGMIDRFSTNFGSEVCPQIIVVGIESNDRYSDFFPNFDNDKFTSFLRDELIPYVNSSYPTNPYKVLIGHSLGGLRVIHTAMYSANLFNSYIAIDPSLGAEKNKWYSMAAKDINQFRLINNRLFVAMAQTMPMSKTQKIDEIRKDTSSDSNHMRMIMDFSEKMAAKNEENNISFKWKFYPDETHSGVTQIATYDGLKFVFDWYQNKSLKEILDVNTSAEKAMLHLKNYYQRISSNLGNKEIPLEYYNTIFIDFLISRNQKEKALAWSMYNLECYPESKNAQVYVEKLKKELKPE